MCFKSLASLLLLLLLILESRITNGQHIGKVYKERTSGYCTDDGGSYILSLSECGEAANKIGLPTITAVDDGQTSSTSSDPLGCYYESSQLKFNNKGNTGQCSSSDKCVCFIGCASGTYQNEAGKTSCKNCQPGKYNSITGATSCKDCKDGSFNVALALSCSYSLCKNQQMLLQGSDGGGIGGGNWYCVDSPPACITSGNQIIRLTGTSNPETIGQRCRCSIVDYDTDCIPNGISCSIKNRSAFHNLLCRNSDYCWSDGTCSLYPELSVVVKVETDSSLELEFDIGDEQQNMNGAVVKVKVASSGFPGQSQRLRFQGCLPYTVGISSSDLNFEKTIMLEQIQKYEVSINTYKSSSDNEIKQLKSNDNYTKSKSEATKLDFRVACENYCRYHNYFAILNKDSDYECTCHDAYPKDLSYKYHCSYSSTNYRPCQEIYPGYKYPKIFQPKLYDFVYGAQAVASATIFVRDNNTNTRAVYSVDVKQQIKQLLGSTKTRLLVEDLSVLHVNCQLPHVSCSLENVARYPRSDFTCSLVELVSGRELAGSSIKELDTGLLDANACADMVQAKEPEADGMKYYKYSSDSNTWRCYAIFGSSHLKPKPNRGSYYSSCFFKQALTSSCPDVDRGTKKKIQFTQMYVDAPRQNGQITIRGKIQVTRSKSSFPGGISVTCVTKEPSNEQWKVIHRKRLSINQFPKDASSKSTVIPSRTFIFLGLYALLATTK